MLHKTWNLFFIGWKTFSQKEKRLVTSIFFFYQNVCKSYFSYSHQKSVLSIEHLTHSHTMTPWRPWGTSLSKTQGKRRNCPSRAIARHEQFLLFPVFFIRFDTFLQFSSNLKLSSANSLSLEESKICHLVMGSGIKTLCDNYVLLTISRLGNIISIFSWSQYLIHKYFNSHLFTFNR